MHDDTALPVPTDPVEEVVACLRSMPDSLSTMPLHQPIDAAAPGLPRPGWLHAPEAPAPVHLYADHYTFVDGAPFARDAADLADTLAHPSRPPLGLLLSLRRIVEQAPRGQGAAVVAADANDPALRALAPALRHRTLTAVLFGADTVATAPASRSDLHSYAVAAPRFTFADLRPLNLALLYVADIQLEDAHWNWFHPERLAETIDASLAEGGFIVFGGAQRGNIQSAILGDFLPLRPGRYEVAYQGRFGAAPEQSGTFLVLRKLRELSMPFRAAMQAASRCLFGGTVRLSHERDASLHVRPMPAIRFGGAIATGATHVIVPSRRITVRSLRDHRYRERFPGYFEQEYTTPEIRLTCLRDGIAFSRLPTCVAAADGTVFCTSYTLEEYLARSPEGAGGVGAALAHGRHGGPYVSAFALDRRVLRDGIPEVTNYIDEPVYFFGIRWMEMYGHFLHEACPQISLWREHLRPLGVKLLGLPLTCRWQEDALRSLGVEGGDIVRFAPNATLMCRELWLSHAFEDARNRVLPEIADFADRTSLSDRSRRRTLRVYAARTDTANRRLANEDELIARLRQEGFVTFVGSEHTLAEQVAMFEQADIVVGKDGTNLTNIIFGDRGTLLVEILGETFFDPLYLRIANIRGMHYDHVIARSVSGAGTGGRDATSIVDVDDVVATIARAAERRRCS